MRYLIVSVLISLILLTACAPARQKLSPHGNIALKDANVYYQQKNIERALESYQKVLKDNPDHVLALRRVADINLYYGEQDQSKTIEFNKLAFENYDKAIAIVESFDNLKETEQVELRDMRRRRTSAWTRIYSAAEQLQNQGNTKEAMRGFQIAIDLDNERFEPLIKLKDIYVKELKDLDKAEKIMLQLYQKRPKEVMLLLEIGAFYYDKQDFSRALDFFQKASVEAPTDADILMNISFCYYEMKDFANALKNTEKVLVLAPRNLDALRNARSIALRLENTNDAIKYLKLILDIEETDREYQDLCILLNNAERFEDLITWGEKWHKYDPTNVMAVQFVSLGAQRTGNTAIELKYNNILRKLQ